MPIDIATEKQISLGEASRLFPPGRRGARVSPGTILRWITGGVKLVDDVPPLARGARVYLEGCRVGGRWMTSIEAVQRFTNSQTPNPAAGRDLDALVGADGHRERTESARAAEAREVEAELEEAGI